MLMLVSQIGRQIGTIEHQIAEDLSKRFLIGNDHWFKAYSRSFLKCHRRIRHNDSVMYDTLKLHIHTLT